MNPDTAKAHFAKFADHPFRPHQAEAAHFVVNRSVAPVAALDGPTGFGKSLMAMVALWMAGGGIYVCSSIQLQEQLARDFPGVPVLMGRANYSCPQCKADNCAQGQSIGCEFDGCPYKAAKARALAAPIKILNYAYYLNEINWVGHFSGAGLVVCDESDWLAGGILDFCSPGIPASLIEEYNLPRPVSATTSTETGLASWQHWGRAVRGTIMRERSRLGADIKAGQFSGQDLVRRGKKHESLSSLASRLKQFIENVDTSWMFEAKPSFRGPGESWSFKPLWITESLARGILWRHAKRFLLMSATLSSPAVFPQLHGVRSQDVDFWPVPSSFPPERRRVYVNSVADMSFKALATSIGPVCAEIKAIMAHHNNEKGLIHCVSYKLGRMIEERLQSDRIVFHENGAGKAAAVEKFMNDDRPLVLLSPSCSRGVSFPDDLCRFIIWPKAPFLSLGDAVVKKRLYSGAFGNLWYVASMLDSVVQGAGRGMRSKNDYCRTYLLDQRIFEALTESRNRGLVPDWFRTALWWGKWRDDITA